MNLSLKETPQSVSVITSKRMEDQQLNNLIDVMKNTTGVWATSQAGNTGLTEFYSRGYKIENFQVDGAKSSFFDTDKMGLENIDTAIYDSVSVVRGATGFLTGAGDPSGSINLVRKKPTKDFQASLEAQTGRWDKYRGVVDIGGGFNEDGSIRGRFIAVHNQGGYFNPLAEKERSTLYGVVEADLGDSTTISGSWERTETKHNGSQHSTTPPRFVYDENWETHLAKFDKYTWVRPEWSRYKQVRDNYTLNLNHHINDSWKIDATYNYTEDDTKRKDALCRSYFRADGTCSSLYGGNPNEYLTKSHSLDVKLNGNFELWEQTHDLVLGFNGEKSKLNSKYYPKIGAFQDMGIINNKWVVIEPIKFGNVVPYYDTRNEQYGGFISTKLNFTDDLSAILGGRYSKWETKSPGDDRKFDNFLPYVALSYDLTENLTTYVSYTEIFNPQNAKDRSGKYLDPETGFNYEVGLKGEWFDGRLNSSIALFQSGKDGLAIQDKDETTGKCHLLPDATSEWDCAYKALDDTKNKGWEFEIAGEITPNWNAQFGFSSSILKDKDGKRLNSTTMPIRTANLFTTYQATPSLTLGGGLRWQDKTWDDSTKNTYINLGREDLVGEAKQDDYFVVDLMANYEFDKNLSLLLNLNNALNKEYKTTFGTYSYGEERNWMATLKYKF
ncbi:TonB-dependent siderophore receptor [Aliarcobacter vitoriensis]|uniref:TonB-dependent receptor n=1 Tax=Aliarcobacter vitoriensis TaxID=2011099 RepID=A0A366MWP5_9BACT|nr:TonB-dependent siderophore receptor [Aliarcobacter vitoriensis]RBQ29822.1 TonB-dependent receptor [Aliarcobacter vitoriensis]